MKLTYPEQCIEDMSWGRPQTRVLRTVFMGWLFSAQVLSISSTSTSHTVFLGALLGGFLSGHASTHKGRSYLLKRSLILPFIGLLLSFFNIAQLSMLLIGFFVGTEIVVGIILALEFLPASKRYLLISLSLAPSLGFLLLLIMDDICKLALVCLCLVALIYDRANLDESPVYLYETGRLEEYKEVLCKINESNGLESEYINYYPILSESKTQTVYFHHEHRVKLFKLALVLLLCGVLSPGFDDSQYYFVCDLLGKCVAIALEKSNVNRKIGIILGFGLSALSLVLGNSTGVVYHVLYSLGFSLIGLICVQAFEAKRRGIASGALVGSFAAGYFIRSCVQRFSFGVLLFAIGVQALFLKCKETSILYRRSNKLL